MPADRTSHERLVIALYRLELSILPHVVGDAEYRRRLTRMASLRQQLSDGDQLALIAEFVRADLPARGV